jgi:hypothetical protein
MNFLYVVVQFDGLISVATRLQAGQPRNQGSILGGMGFFFSLQHQDWPWGPSILLSDEYWDLCP